MIKEAFVFILFRFSRVHFRMAGFFYKNTFRTIYSSFAKMKLFNIFFPQNEIESNSSNETVAVESSVDARTAPWTLC